MATTKVPEERAAEIRLLLEDDLQHDLSGTRPFRDAGQMFSRPHGDPCGPEDRCLTLRPAEGQLIQSKAHTFVLSLAGYCGADGITILCLKLSGSRVRRGFCEWQLTRAAASMKINVPHSL
jgi:hypothetical protein